MAARLSEARRGRSAPALLQSLHLPSCYLLPVLGRKKNLIKLFRSASPNFLSRPLALGLEGEIDTDPRIGGTRGRYKSWPLD